MNHSAILSHRLWAVSLWLLLALSATNHSVTAQSVDASPQEISVPSPGHTLDITVRLAPDGRLTYAVTACGDPVLLPSPLGLIVDSVDLGAGPHFAGPPTVRDLTESFSLHGNHAQGREHFTEADIPLENAGRKFNLVVRAADDGIAFRYVLPDGSKTIGGETTAWNLPADAGNIAWMELSQCYEGYSHVTPLDGVPTNKTIMGPLTIQLPGRYLSLAEADNENFSDLAYTRHDHTLAATFPFSTNGWTIQRRADKARPGVLDGTYQGRPATPWRTAIVVPDLTRLVNSDLLLSLCPPPAPGTDFTWVQPGRCLWQWWSIGAPRYEDQKDWVDAAVKLHWEYYLIDEGWREWKQPGKDQWQLLKEVIAYGRSVGIKSLVWVNSKEMRHAKNRRAYLEKVKALGAVGIKIDFHPNPTADYLQWYMGAMQDCAELNLLVNFHGSVKPSGLRRTYPNDITREAVRGDEYQMTRYHRVMPLAQEVSLPFTRPLAGPADITPVMLNPRELKTAGFTWPHEFAQAIVYQSSITHFADNYKFYVESPLLDLFREIPTVWDETVVLPGTEMGEVVAYARRKDNVWWVGVLNGAHERELKIPLTFLKAQAQASLVYDHPATDAAVDRHEQSVTAGDTLTVKLRPAGGFVGRFTSSTFVP